MTSITYFGVEKPQSTNFGVSHKNIETNLTEGNWENKATCRVHPEGVLYIQIKEGRTHEVEKDPVTIYRVCAHIPLPVVTRTGHTDTGRNCHPSVRRHPSL